MIKIKKKDKLDGIYIKIKPNAESHSGLNLNNSGIEANKQQKIFFL
jgi:hypothetical protein